VTNALPWHPLAVAAAGITAWVVIGAGLLQIMFYMVQLVYAAISLAKRPPVSQAAVLWRRYSEQAPPIAVLAPAFNEEVTIIESVNSLLSALPRFRSDRDQ
jgi:cellulose synthase/poly-beta-1,6-N-acetylglucosamine synthase-like glycosyltransferase